MENSPPRGIPGTGIPGTRYLIAGRLAVDQSSGTGLPNLVAEYSLAVSTPGSGGLAPALRRYVFGAGGEPLVQYEGSGNRHALVAARLRARQRGRAEHGNGEANAINSYDEYGIPGASEYEANSTPT